MNPSLKAWIPIRIYQESRRYFVDWCHAGSNRFTDPFFEQTIGTILRHPANLLFRHQTPIETLAQFDSAPLSPTGFIFHLSRCGSTLLSQMLAASPRNVVISEAPVIDTLLRTRQDPSARFHFAKWLRGLVHALGQPRHGEDRFFVKLDCWHIRYVDLIHSAFPATPWVFLYRDPLEILVSHAHQPGSQMIPGFRTREILGDRSTGWPGAPDEYAVEVLAVLAEAALAARGIGRNLFLNYTQLPGRAWPDLTRLWNLTFGPGEMEGMFQSARFHAKAPSLFFESDSQRKQTGATPRLRELAQRLQPAFLRLEEQSCAGIKEGPLPPA